MALILAIGEVLALLAAGWMFCLAWQRRHIRDTPVYIWPREDLCGWHQRQECNARAREAFVYRQLKTPGLQAQWDSGLGRAFPLNHLN